MQWSHGSNPQAGILSKGRFVPMLYGQNAAFVQSFVMCPISGRSVAAERQIFIRRDPAPLDAPHDFPQRAAAYSTSRTLSPVSESNR